MSNADILFGFIGLLSYMLMVAPIIACSISNNLSYKEAIILGNGITLVLIVVVVIGVLLLTTVTYFISDINQESPAMVFIEWVNRL